MSDEIAFAEPVEEVDIRREINKKNGGQNVQSFTSEPVDGKPGIFKITSFKGFYGTEEAKKEIMSREVKSMRYLITDSLTNFNDIASNQTKRKLPVKGISIKKP